MFSRDDPLNTGFAGFIGLKEIGNDFSIFPDYKGLYIIYIEENLNVSFYNPGTGGFFKRKNPNVQIDELNKKWVGNTNILYIGRAGSTAKNG